MQLDASLSWLALALTPGVAARLSARLLRQFGSPEGVFRASLNALESAHIPVQSPKPSSRRNRSSAPKKSWRLYAISRAALF